MNSMAALRQQLRHLSVKYEWQREFASGVDISTRKEFNDMKSHIWEDRNEVQVNDNDDNKSLSKAVNTLTREKCRRQFIRQRHTFTQEARELFNDQVFYGKIPADLPIVWSKHLKRTAGVTRIFESKRTCTIELSMKVLDDKKRLETTLLHELCHVAAFLIDGEFKPPHGASFRRWADRAERVLGYVVTTCHNYDIFTPHKFKCVNDTCGQVYGRHSKKGIRVESQICGCCRGKLEYQGVFDVDGKMREQRALTPFSIHVKENFSVMKAGLPAGTPHKNVMKALSQTFKRTTNIDAFNV